MKKIKLDYPENSIAIFGGNWGTSSSSNRCARWFYAPSEWANIIAYRGISNHFKG